MHFRWLAEKWPHSPSCIDGAAAASESEEEGGVGLIGFGSGGRGVLIGDYSEGRLE